MKSLPRADSKLLSRREAANLLNVREHTLAVWAVEGRGPRFAKIGRLARYRAEDLERFIDESMVCTSAK